MQSERAERPLTAVGGQGRWVIESAINSRALIITNGAKPDIVIYADPHLSPFNGRLESMSYWQDRRPPKHIQRKVWKLCAAQYGVSR